MGYRGGPHFNFKVKSSALKPFFDLPLYILVNPISLCVQDVAPLAAVEMRVNVAGPQGSRARKVAVCPAEGNVGVCVMHHEGDVGRPGGLERPPVDLELGAAAVGDVGVEADFDADDQIPVGLDAVHTSL